MQIGTARQTARVIDHSVEDITPQQTGPTINTGGVQRMGGNNSAEHSASMQDMKQTLQATAQAQPMPPESEQVSSVIDEPQLARSVLLPPTAQVEAPKKKTLQDLFLTGRSEKVFTVDTFEFKMRTLRSDETTDALDAASQYGADNEARQNAIRINILSRSIISVNGEPLNHLFPLVQKEAVRDGEIGPLVKKITVVASFPQPLLMQLWVHYNALMNEGYSQTSPANVQLKN
jgi:hypothetical protein